MAHVVRELDLSAYCRHDTMIQRVSAVPGLKTSTAFFIFLRANLVASSSGFATPIMDPISSATLPPSLSSPLVTIETPADAIPDDLPSLSAGVLETQTEKEDALRLIADSIAQQRQTSSSYLIFHPFLLAPLIAALAGAYQYAWVYRGDLGTALLMTCGVIMTYLLGIRYCTGGYIQAAEELRWSWLSPTSNPNPPPSEQDMMLGVRFGKQLIGALVLRLEPSPSSTHAPGGGGGGGGRRRSRSSLLRGGRGVIRAWTVKLRYRGQGVARDMLHEAVRLTRERCGRDAEVGFAAEHANSRAVLPEPFNAPFRRSERKAAKSLEKVLAEWEGSRRRR
ncbi:putative acetyltransferase protein [Rosellinia necatrix]|uniref:Putative acetyltransferase protein n=1 Tax=Rosellinia necatrix TaxID=77044 RepID=A0A1S7UI83_ROSNE|nr:putative acetyltransferase protein [Rosellinia necatrix]